MIAVGYYLLSLTGQFILEPIIAMRGKFAKMTKAKETVTVDELCATPLTSVLKSYMTEVFRYDYGEEPYYAKLRHFLTIELVTKNTYPSEDLFKRPQRQREHHHLPSPRNGEEDIMAEEREH